MAHEVKGKLSIALCHMASFAFLLSNVGEPGGSRGALRPRGEQASCGIAAQALHLEGVMSHNVG